MVVQARRRVLVTGMVQGVFFRDTCRRVATELGVCGWVQNLADGRVEAVFEGPAEHVDQMVAWAHRGSSHSVVDEVRVHVEQPEGLVGFAVRG